MLAVLCMKTACPYVRVVHEGKSENQNFKSEQFLSHDLKSSALLRPYELKILNLTVTA